MGLSHHRVGILFSADGPYGLVGRAMLNGALLAVAEVKDTFAVQGAETVIGSPEDFQKFLAREYATTAKVMKLAQLQQE